MKKASNMNMSVSERRKKNKKTRLRLKLGAEIRPLAQRLCIITNLEEGITA